jgi:hypothetical protein
MLKKTLAIRHELRRPQPSFPVEDLQIDDVGERLCRPGEP